ncbi:hypothetical protein Pla163_27100 [Planctomycetes bacterium Pla163]|uniref:DUF3592 domain-containing protein n=2 Tax=Rohdeia mirabilis TaxID=2528008 RepID=A0A518D275_9BACT|nr:hypothetical protein Pla163_27100 [Planctomycetes bacterium Pla163]
MPGCVRTFFPLPFILAGLIAVWIASGDVIDGLRSADWPQVTGTVTESFVETHESDDSATYSVQVRYLYSVDGVEHTGDRVAFTRWNHNDLGAAEAVRKRYPVGASVVVFHSADRPQDAVLEPGLFAGALGMLAFGVVFALVGLVLFFRFRRTLPTGADDATDASSAPST